MSPSWRSRIAQRFADERRTRLLAANTARNLLPPPPRAFAAFGQGSWIVPPSRVTMPEAISIGDDVVVHEHSWISVVDAVPGWRPRLTIGNHCRIGSGCHIACVGEIEIAEAVLTGARVFIGDTYHGYEDPTIPVLHQPMAPPRKVTIGRGVFLGIGSVVLAGVTVGEGAYVGAGAVVTHDVEARTLVVGNPARAVRRFDTELGAWTDTEQR